MLAEDELERLVRNRNVLAALLEAALAALFLEHGFEPIEEAIVAAFSGRIEYALTTLVDHKTELQEALARDGRQVSYAVSRSRARRTSATSRAAARVDGEESGVGRGRVEEGRRAGRRQAGARDARRRRRAAGRRRDPRRAPS